MKKIILLTGILCLSGCAQVQSDVVKYQQQIQTACDDVLPIANSPEVAVAAIMSSTVDKVQKAVVAGCSDAESIAQMAKSATTVQWLGTAKTVMASGGTVLPPPVLPVPVS